MAWASLTPFQYRCINIKTKTEKALLREIYGSKNTVLYYINAQSFTTSPPNLPNPHISFLGTEEMQTKMCRAYSVGTQEVPYEDSEAKTYPVSATRSHVQRLQWQINDTTQPQHHKERMERTCWGKKDVRYNTVTLQEILDTKDKARVHEMDG